MRLLVTFAAALLVGAGLWPEPLLALGEVAADALRDGSS
jgi:hypothetical protein